MTIIPNFSERKNSNTILTNLSTFVFQVVHLFENVLLQWCSYYKSNKVNFKYTIEDGRLL